MRTIRIKIIVFLLAFLSFMAFNSAMYWWNIVSFRDRLVVLDEFHDVLSDILEIRRYEKNFIFYPEPDSIKEALNYLEQTENTIQILYDTMVDIEGQKSVNRFMGEMKEYKSHLSTLAHGEETDLTRTRNLGASLVSFAQQLLVEKKVRIDKALSHILYMPIGVMICLSLLIVGVFSWQAKQVMDRLAYVQRAAEGVAKGEYDAIQQIKKDDNISELMRSAFTKMADEIESRQEELIESRKLVSIGTLTSGIAHELNNPLNNVSLTADTLLEEYNNLTEAEAKEMLLDIINETSRASEVVRNLLDFSREEHHPMRPLIASELIEKTLKLVRNQLMLDGVQIVVDFAKNLPLINGDLHYLEQVFINLFMNATQAMPEGGTITITGRADSRGYVHIDVADTGTGMSTESLERIFDPFYTTKPVGRGTGLGLSIVYGIIKKHGGYIEVHSEVGKGTTFSVYLLTTGQECDNDRISSSRH
ncbi:ATP-binding protein [Desulfovibrio inopinatus]|uniref:ATP-binding protein n=1 Tax=Desulfovibrio inopinatus TaxID=102109 RepID=UPI000684B49C|nr:ATP-binding protein [Desulfovibrio inopinatus]